MRKVWLAGVVALLLVATPALAPNSATYKSSLFDDHVVPFSVYRRHKGSS
ncbi:MAG: hypothetical protein QJR08_09245 [Bacillota bacterium]|nr:hypothetical protein [Bacillota bacterium]